MSSTPSLVKLHLRDRVEAVIFTYQLGLVIADQPALRHLLDDERVVVGRGLYMEGFGR